MRAVLVVLALTLVAAAPAAASGGRVVTTCDRQSQAAFQGAYRDADNLVVGPLAWIGARAPHTGGANAGEFRWKHQLLVQPGHRVTVRIGAAAAGFAGLTYNFQGWGFARSHRTVVFQACPRSRAASRSDRGPVTFWSGGISATVGAGCVPVEIRIDRGPVRHRTIALGAARCAQGA
jgi:hypothetical protein